MKVINFTSHNMPGVQQETLQYPSNLTLCLAQGKTIYDVCQDIVNQIEMKANPTDTIVLDLPSIYFGVEQALAAYGIVQQVMYYQCKLAFPSPVFAYLTQVIAENRHLHEICKERCNSLDAVVHQQ